MLGVVAANQSGHVVVAELYMGGPAQIAGLLPGDQILSVDGKATTNAQGLIELIAGYQPHSVADVFVARNGWTRHYYVTLASRADVIGLPRSGVAARTRQERRYSYRVGADDWLDAETARNIYDPYLACRSILAWATETGSLLLDWVWPRLSCGPSAGDHTRRMQLGIEADILPLD